MKNNTLMIKLTSGLIIGMFAMPALADNARDAEHERVGDRLERRGDHAHQHLDRKGDRINHNPDRKGNRVARTNR